MVAIMSRTVQDLLDLRGKTALLTHAATGAGLQLAYALGEVGARVVISAHAPDALERACAELQDAGIDARWIALHSDEDAQLQRLVDETLHRVGAIDVLVNNPGPNWTVHAYWYLAHAVASRSMVEHHGGRIIHVVPQLERHGLPHLLDRVAAQTTRSTVQHLTRRQSAEWAPQHITVNAICPDAVSGHLPAALFQTAGEDLKGPCLLLASDAGQHISGQCIDVCVAWRAEDSV